MKKLYEFYWNCGRMGSLEGVFICEEARVKKVLGDEVYFGEVLGKHSQIYGTLEEKDIKVLSNDQEFIKKLFEVFGKETISGYNPITTWEYMNKSSL